MDLDQIRNRWIREENNAYDQAGLWDCLAERFRDAPPPGWKENPFLARLDKDISRWEDLRVLDIGCGTGKYAFPLSDRARSVLGVDLSSRMIDFAEEKRRKAPRENLTFLCGDFREFSSEEKFGLVFAHMTPAVADAESFEKMLSLAGDYCYMVKPVRKKEPLLAGLREAAGIRKDPARYEDGILYAFAFLWKLGKNPEVSYRQEVWEHEYAPEEAEELYCEKIMAGDSLTGEQRKAIRNCLEKQMKDGRIKETVYTTIATMSWRMNQDENR